MNSSNNNKYVLKCYINVFYIVPNEMESARQFNCPSYAEILLTILTQFKKLLKKYISQ